MPAGLRAAFLQARQKEAGAEYQVADRGGQVTAANAAHQLAMTLDSQGVHWRHAQGAGQGSLRLVRAGCAERPEPVAAVDPRGRGTRVEYQRPGLTEWYLNGPMGLEQGFTVTREGCSRLALDLQVEGDWTARISGSGAQAQVELRDSGSGQRAYYSDLYARDAHGQELGTRMQLVGQTIRLEVEAAGADYPVEVDPVMYTQQILSSSNSGDSFGCAVAMSADTAVIGACQTQIGSNLNQGEAYVYVLAGTTWMQQQMLTASDGAANDRFGTAVAVSGDTMVVGAPGKSPGGNTGQGQAYVYVRTGTTWTEQQKLLASDGFVTDSFGSAVAVSGDTAVVGALGKTVSGNGAQGQAYVYLRAGTTWSEQQKLLASDGAAKDNFGNSVALVGDTAVVGAPGKTVGGKSAQGQAYVYLRAGAAWTEQQKFVAADGVASDRFGCAVALSVDTAVVGARGGQGQAYVYLRAGTTWALQQKLTAADGVAGDVFGSAVALSGDTAVIGAFGKTVGGNSEQGQAYVYVRTGTAWTLQQKLLATNGATNDAFGYAVAASGDNMLVGMLKLSGVGQAYAFHRTAGANGSPCTLPSDCSSGFCTDGLCCDTACGGSDKTDCQSCLAAESGGTDGTCSPIAKAKRTLCRAAAGPCDVAETCDGSGTVCPADALQPAGTVCRAAPDAAHLDATCSAAGADCPANPAAPAPPEAQPAGGCSCEAALGSGGTARSTHAAAAASAAMALFLMAARRRSRRRHARATAQP